MKKKNVSMYKTLILVSFLFIQTLFASPVSIDLFRQNTQGIYEETIEDYNHDLINDHLFYINQGEATSLVLLLSNKSNFISINLPLGDEYKVVSEYPFYAFQIQSLHNKTSWDLGAQYYDSKYPWYDHYIVSGDRLINNNELYKTFYKKMAKKYSKRIKYLSKKLKKYKKTRNNIDELDPEYMKLTYSIKNYKEYLNSIKNIVK